MAGHPGCTWREYAAAVRRLAPGFAGTGVGPGDAVAMLVGPRPEFHVVDTALLHAGAVPFSLQEGDTVQHLVENLAVAGAGVLVTEERLLPLAREVIAAAARPVALVCVDGRAVRRGERTLAEVAGTPGPDFDSLWRAVRPADVATLIFTSGTTGRPKAVELSHRAITASEQGTHRLAPFGDPTGTVLSYLPLNHIAERFMSHYASLTFGVAVRSVPDPDTLYDTIREVRPVRFFGVPRVYEKLADRARALIGTDPALGAALTASLLRVRADQAGKDLTVDQQRAAAAGVDALAPVRAALGLDRAEYVGVATAPSAYALLEFLLALGLRISDIWGMSEAIMCTLNPPDAIRLGTVGRFLDGVQGRIAEDGEILVRGPNCFSGYRGDPQRTRETRDDEGWVHTGDVGSIDDGYLTVRGRKKELLITATGKNLAPGVIEGAISSASPLIDHVVAIAEGRRHVTALIALDAAEVQRWGVAHGIDGDFSVLAAHPRMQQAVADAVAAGNGTLARPERVRAFRIVATEWRPGGDEVTATAKLRRAEIARRYATEIEELYS
jgi:long-subunit acyl-CoA synthetase (AMP-forming)